ncbi:MAG: UDP-2,4-diacetamido-2,4,6-trideoxy-beta-L-altropyranose hydrolase [Defluviitaleaceae bacterium]|nr:UDP-2,4-diacetamido-2,4,6-trideoxy-beta-L-altropyranose hydrolase [Defluviitaleaceae bacterium]
MNIAFRADGSLKIGMGHLMRCVALADIFKNDGDSILFFCNEKTKDGIAWLNHKEYQVVELCDNTSVENEAIELNTLLNKFKVDVIIVDSYRLSSEYFRILMKSDAVIVIIDDHAKFDYTCDILINGDFDAQKHDYSKYSTQKNLLGTDYCILRNEFSTTMPSPLRNIVSNILITMGGSDPNNFTPIVLNALSPIKGITIHVACASLMNNTNDIKREADKCLSKVILHSPPNSMAKLMSECDLAISAGGGTVKELFAMGVVSLFISQADNQLSLMNYLQKNNLHLYLGSHSEVTAQQIYSQVSNLIDDYHERKRIRSVIIDKICRNGATTIVTEIKNFTHIRRKKHEYIYCGRAFSKP